MLVEVKDAAYFTPKFAAVQRKFGQRTELLDVRSTTDCDKTMCVKRSCESMRSHAQGTCGLTRCRKSRVEQPYDVIRDGKRRRQSRRFDPVQIHKARHAVVERTLDQEICGGLVGRRN